VALAALMASRLGTLAGPQSVAATGGERVAVLFPFDGGGNTWVSGDGPDVHTAYFAGFGWAEDLHAADGTAVKARFQSSDGAITLKVLAVDDLFCTPSAGKYAAIEVKVDGTVAGRMIYEHLNNVPAAIAVNASIGVGDTLGYLNLWDQSSCWAETLSDGLVHTHMEFQKACYRRLTAETTYRGSMPMGLLGSAYSTTNKSACDEGDITSVTSSASSLIAVLLLGRRRPVARRCSRRSRCGAGLSAQVAPRAAGLSSAVLCWRANAPYPRNCADTTPQIRHGRDDRGRVASAGLVDGARHDADERRKQRRGPRPRPPRVPARRRAAWAPPR
jgi:hypothetical protein